MRGEIGRKIVRDRGIEGEREGERERARWIGREIGERL